MVAAMQHLPVGYRFHPTEEERFHHYLLRKNRGEEDPVCVIPELDLCSWEPEELVGYFRETSIFQWKGPQWWFFCEQSPARTQKRSTEGGYWKKTGLTKDVKSRDGTKRVLGSKKILTFFRGKSSRSTKTDWIMHEYDLKRSALNSSPSGKNYVLCMIKCNSDDLLEPAADDGFIPEHMVQAQMRQLEALCWTPNHEHTAMCIPFPETCTNSADSFHMQYLRAGDSIKSEQPAVIMENKQSQKPEPLYAFLPMDEKKGIVKDNLPPLTTSVRAEAPKVKIEEECIKMISQANQKHTPIKIEEISISNAGSSTSNPHPETEPVSRSCSQSIKQRSSSSQSMVYARNLLVGIVLCFVIFREMFKPLIF